MKPAVETNQGEGQKRIYLDTNLQIIFGVTLMAVLGVSSITPAFPKIVQELGISSKAIGLLITVFTFPGVVLTPVLGILADRFGRKKILVPALMLFGIAGGACAFARDFDLLLIPIIIFGIAHGVNIPNLQTLLAGLAPIEYRAAFMSVNGMVLRLGQTLGPLVMGAVFGMWGIGSVFYAGASFSIAMLVLVVLMIK